MDNSDDPTLRVPEGPTILLNRYRVEGELGRGAMGAVHRCFDQVAGVTVALKDIPPELSRNDDEMEEVRRNFQLICHLSHPHIAQIRTLEQDPDTGAMYLVMDLVDGVNLRSWFNHQPAAPEALLPLVRHIAEALDYAHSERIVHRDIKPTNIMVTQNGQAKVLDFGLAAQLHSSMSRLTGITYGTSGTLPYMSPEQWRGKYQDGKTDQYALGIIVYELLVGRYPFDVFDPTVLREAVLNEPPESANEIPDSMWPPIQRCLSKNPDDRYPDCRSFAADLEAGFLGKTSTPRGSGPPTFLWAAVAVLLIGCVGGAWWVSQQQNQPSKVEQVKVEDVKPPVEPKPLPPETPASEPSVEIKPPLPKPSSPDPDPVTIQPEHVPESVPPPNVEPEPPVSPPSLNLNEVEAANLQQEAQASFNGLLNLRPGQGFRSKVERVGERLKAANLAYQNQNWSAASAGFEGVKVAAQALEDYDALREEAFLLKSRLEETRSKAGETSRSQAWFAKGLDHFEQGELEQAIKEWEKVEQEYTNLLARKNSIPTVPTLVPQTLVPAAPLPVPKPAAVNVFAPVEDLVRKGLWNEGEAELEKLVVEHGESETSRLLKGRIYARKKGWSTMALREFQEAIKMNPETVQGRLGLAEVYIMREEFPEARTELSKVLALDATHPRAKSLLKSLPQPKKRPPAKSGGLPRISN